MAAPQPADHEATQRARLWFGLYFVYMIVTIYWTMTTTGPALWLARAQAAVFGDLYSMKLTALLLNLPAFLFAAWMTSKPVAASRK